MQKLTPLTAAVISILAVQHSYANETDNPHVELGTMIVNIDRQGTKPKPMWLPLKPRMKVQQRICADY